MQLRFFYVDGGIHPQHGQIFHWAAEALGETDVARYNHYLCGVLSAVAQTPEDCSRLLHFINQVEQGGGEQVETGGNDVTLTLNSSGVQVDIEVNEDWIAQPEGHFTLQEWKSALEGWRTFLQMPHSLDSVIEVNV